MSDPIERLRATLEELRAAGRVEEARVMLEGFLARTEPQAEADGVAVVPDVPMRFGLVGDSAPMQAVFRLIERAAPSNVPVLIQGETGTGKELVARALHEHSPRKRKRFMAENCAAVPAALLESELFGHKRGSFTGAVADRDGHFVAADGGSLFLDEIGDMPLEMQAKLLRALETGEIRPVGSSQTRKVDVRFVAATHRDLTEMVKQRSFREDLYYRLNVVRIALPPLCERPEDIPHLVRFFLARVGVEMGRPDATLSAEAVAELARRRWPGNVRELENELRRVLAMTRGPIGVADLSPASTLRAASASTPPSSSS
jgi:transcriptional regulator with GAF, ATPase, and Fis domain